MNDNMGSQFHCQVCNKPLFSEEGYVPHDHGEVETAKHELLTNHLKNIASTTKSLPYDLDAFGDPTVTKTLEEATDHLTNASPHLMKAISEHKKQNYSAAGQHLHEYGNHWIKAANVFTRDLPGAPLTTSFSSRVNSMQGHIGNYIRDTFGE